VPLGAGVPPALAGVRGLAGPAAAVALLVLLLAGHRRPRPI